MNDYKQPILVVTSETQLKISPVSFKVERLLSKSQVAQARVMSMSLILAKHPITYQYCL